MRATIELRLFGDAEGGRTGPVAVGYSPDWITGQRTPDGDDFHMGRIAWLEVDPLWPGHQSRAVVETFWPDGRGWTHLRTGDLLSVHEGSRAIGTATVVDPLTDT